MKHNPFVPREWRTAILTFDNGHRARAEVLLPGTDKLTKMAKTVYEITDEYSEKNELHCLVLMSDKIGGASFTIGSESAIVKEFKELAKRHDAFKNILNKLKQL